MRRASTILCSLLLAGCAAFGIRSPTDQAEATLLATHTLHDYEIARAASSSALAHLEGAFQLAPDDEGLMILLADAWVMHAELFLIDAYERARVAGPRGDADYQRERVATGFERGRYWGLAWLEARVPDLDTAALTEATLPTLLREEFDDPEDATALLVLGHAFLGAATFSPELHDEDPKSETTSRTLLAKLGASFLEHSLELDENTRLGAAHGLLGVYYAEIGQDPVRAARHFQRAALLDGGKYLLTALRSATSLRCREHDRDAFESELDRVLKSGDPLPEVRLDNAVAKRRASRWLVEESLNGDCGF